MLWIGPVKQVDNASIIEILTRAYCEPHRCYHTLSHITYMFDVARKYGIPLDTVQIKAIWWHDAVYVPGSNMNEVDSVNLMLRYEEDTDITHHAANIILDTETRLPRSPESAIVLDLDMVIFADTEEAYQRYVRQIRSEYSVLSDREWKEGRLKFLHKLKEREVFHSAKFSNYNILAEHHIDWEIRELNNLL